MFKPFGLAALALTASIGHAQAADCAREFGPQTNVAALLACITEVNAEVEEIRRMSIRTGLPKNAVLAFDDPNGCPAGWTPYSRADGRVIIGVTTGKSPLSQRFYGEEGGKEIVTLTEATIPQHQHALLAFLGFNETGGDITPENQIKIADGEINPARSETYRLRGTDLEATHGRSSTVGEGQPHENMPPFIALFYCKKD